MSTAASNATAGSAPRGVLQRRFLRSLPIGKKLGMIAVILAIPMLGLGYFYVNSFLASYTFTHKEQLGMELNMPVVAMARATVRHMEAQSADVAGLNPPAAELQKAASDVEAALADLRKEDAAKGSAASHGLLGDVLHAWERVRSSQPAGTQEILSAHETLLDALFAFKAQLGSDFNLVLDSEATSYTLIDSTLMKAPDLNRAIGEVRVHLASMAQRGHTGTAEAWRTEQPLSIAQDRLVALRGNLDALRESVAGNAAWKQRIESMDKGWDTAVIAWLGDVGNTLSSGNMNPDQAARLLAASASIADGVEQLAVATDDFTDDVLAKRMQRTTRTAIVALGFSGLAMLLAIGVVMVFARRITGGVSRLMTIAARIADGNYDNVIDRTGEDEVSRLYDAVAAMQQKLNEEREKERAAVEREHHTVIVNERVRQALECVDTCVMLADEKGNILFVNKRLISTLGAAQQYIRKSLPQFDVNKLVGSNMDAFHKSPSHQRNVVEHLKTSHAVTLEFAGKVFRLTATPVTAEGGSRIGTVVEWLDRTQEVGIEKEVEGIVSAVINGDLSQRLSLEGKAGFFEVLSKGINGLVDNVTEVVTQVKASAYEVNRGASEISLGNANLAQRTEEQASSLEQTASSMEQMTSTVKQNADNAGQANQLAVAARDQADKGGAVVARAVKAMSEINTSSRKIADIIGVIDEIAFQTNLLALNAAVEAARAGEQGRGFAVVASEVRSLAGRSASAAKEIKELIQDSVRKVDEGSELVTQSGQTLDQIVAAVKKVGDIVAEIAAASQEQSAGIEQVNKAVMQLDELTQQNAALVEQATAASQSMADQAQNLNEVMARYQVEEPSGAAAKPAARAAAAAPAAERRSGSRPWGGRTQGAAAPAAAKAAAKTATKAPTKTAAASESEWNEF